MYVLNLPPEAVTWRKEQPWSQTDHLLAALVDAVGHWGYVNAKPHYKRLSKPTPVDRPGAASTSPVKRVVKSLGEVASWFARNGGRG